MAGKRASRAALLGAAAGAEELLYELVSKADIFCTNFTQSAIAKLKIDFETLKKYNPKLIYGLATGYGLAGPESKRRAFDSVAQARSGIMYALGGEPDTPPAQIDIILMVEQVAVHDQIVDKAVKVDRLVERPVEKVVDKPVTLERVIERLVVDTVDKVVDKPAQVSRLVERPVVNCEFGVLVDVELPGCGVTALRPRWAPVPPDDELYTRPGGSSTRAQWPADYASFQPQVGRANSPKFQTETPCFTALSQMKPVGA